MISPGDAEERIKTIVRRGVALGRRPSDGRLLWEYVRRVASLQNRHGMSLGGLFFNPRYVMTTEMEAIADEQKGLKEITRTVNITICKHLMEYYVLWALLVMRKHPVALLEPEVYEPLIRMFERGAAFSIHKHEALFETFAISLLDWTTPQFSTPFELDDGSLDKYDKDKVTRRLSKPVQ